MASPAATATVRLGLTRRSPLRLAAYSASCNRISDERATFVVSAVTSRYLTTVQPSLGFPAQIPEESLEKLGALLGKNTARDSETMIEPLIAGKVVQRADRTGLGIGRTVHETLDRKSVV